MAITVAVLSLWIVRGSRVEFEQTSGRCLSSRPFTTCCVLGSFIRLRTTHAHHVADTSSGTSVDFSQQTWCPCGTKAHKCLGTTLHLWCSSLRETGCLPLGGSNHVPVRLTPPTGPTSYLFLMLAGFVKPP